MADSSNAKYLTRYAHSLSQDPFITEFALRKRYVLVIPAFNERFDFIYRLAEHDDAGQVLLIVVANEPDTATGTGTGADTNHKSHLESSHLFLNAARKHAVPQQISDCGENSRFIHATVKKLSCLFVDCTANHALPAKKGVGLARKIGADIAVSLITQGNINCPWIFNTDADVLLPSDYFTTAKKAADEAQPTSSALVYDYTHIATPNCTPETLEATQLYERCIRYYTQQLKAAGSPYAYHTLGSCIAVHTNHYCMVRGFPQKAAGEDFYLLNKLAKVGHVIQLGTPCMQIFARASDRVPFGTGPAAERIRIQIQQGERPTYYNPQIFIELKHFLSCKDLFWHSELDAQKQLPKAVLQALEQAGFDDFIAKRKRQDKSLAAFQRSFDHWFDAFQTLKFVRRLEASRYPAATIEDIMALKLM